MKTSVIDVRDMLSVLSVLGVEQRIGEVPGVESATVNYAASTATVRYDESRLDIAGIKAGVRQRAYESEGESLSKRLSDHTPALEHAEVPTPNAASASLSPPDADASIASSSSPDSAPAPAAPAPAAPAPAAPAPAAPAPAAPSPKEHEGHETPGAPPTKPADMAHEMGHGGKDLPAMVRDMRNRFLIALVFTVPIFVYAPMAELFKPPAPPFGLKLDLWLFFLATAAILYPGWPFVVSAWRALRTRTLSMAVLVVLSVGTGYLFSVGTTFFFKGGGQFFEAAAVLLVFILLGHWLEMRARAGASSAIRGADESHSGKGVGHSQRRRG